MATPRTRPPRQSLTTVGGTTTTPTMSKSASVKVGDSVSVPGDMNGIVRFLGEVRGKQGVFAGVELDEEWAARGKNDGAVEGVHYFHTTVPGSGIFLPVNRVEKLKASPKASTRRPTTSAGSAERIRSFNRHNDAESTPPTPVTNFRPKSRLSLPRPESPVRRGQNAYSAAGGRPSLNTLSHNRLAGPRFAPSPTPGKTPGRAPRAPTNNFMNSPAQAKSNRRVPPKSEEDGSEINQLRALLREKNERIEFLTVEFDSHRADFRNTLDTLESAAAETERVYERRIDDLQEEVRVLSEQSEDVDSVAEQLRQLEEVVQELEEGLEDARRGEAEARGENEFLRGEVERVRAELRREREQNSQPIEVEDQGNEAEEHASVDADKWCALCEGDGHDSISCPYEQP